MIEDYETKLNSMTNEFLDNCGNLLQKARDLETLYFHVSQQLCKFYNCYDDDWFDQNIYNRSISFKVLI